MKFHFFVLAEEKDKKTKLVIKEIATLEAQISAVGPSFLFFISFWTSSSDFLTVLWLTMKEFSAQKLCKMKMTSSNNEFILWFSNGHTLLGMWSFFLIYWWKKIVLPIFFSFTKKTKIGQKP